MDRSFKSKFPLEEPSQHSNRKQSLYWRFITKFTYYILKYLNESFELEPKL